MYKLLIVDDERHVLRYLSGIFSSQTEYELAITCADSGVDALYQMNRDPADIAILDIRMPGFSGLELGREIQKYWTDTRLIFLTAYDDFESIYCAGKLKNTQYLLKLEDEREIIAALGRAIESIKRDAPAREKTSDVNDDSPGEESADNAARVACMIKKYVDENLSKDVSLADIALYVNYTPAYVSRVFKRATGMKLFEYVVYARVKEAKRLLAETNLRVKEIAEAVSMPSPNYFAKVFRRSVGQSPQEYRLARGAARDQDENGQ